MKNLFKASLTAAGAVLMLTSQSYMAPKADTTARFNTPFELKLNEQVFLPKAKKELAVSLVSIVDNRCPENVQCTTAGNATAEIKLTGKGGSETVTKLTLGQSETAFKTADTISVELENINYQIVLNEINRLFANKALIVVKKEAI